MSCSDEPVGASSSPELTDRQRPTEQPAPSIPWTSWEQVHELRESLHKHRFLLMHRPEHLTA
jgi:hypothetical protein